MMSSFWGALTRMFTRKPPEPKPEEDAVETLSDMVRGIAHSVATADEIADERFMHTLRHYFDEGDDHRLTPKVVVARVSENHDAVVPLVALLDHSTQRLAETTVRMKVRMAEVEVKDALRHADEKLKTQRASFRIAHHGIGRDEHSQTVDVEMRFERADAPEGVGRVLDLLDVHTVEHKAPDGADPALTVPEDPDGPEFEPQDAPAAADGPSEPPTDGTGPIVLMDDAPGLE